MPKENRFAGLGEAIGGDAEAEQSDVEEDESDAVDTDREHPNRGAADDSGGVSDTSESEDVEDGEESSEIENSEESSEDETGSESEESVENEEGNARAESNESDNRSGDESEETGPAFEFEATTAKSIYVRRATLDQLDDAEFEVESLLRREHDIRNLTGREFHDALVRIATEHPDEIVDAILETRERER